MYGDEPVERRIEIPRSAQTAALEKHILGRMDEIRNELTSRQSEEETAIRRGRYAELEELLDKFSFSRGIEP